MPTSPACKIGTSAVNAWKTGSITCSKVAETAALIGANAGATDAAARLMPSIPSTIAAMGIAIAATSAGIAMIAAEAIPTSATISGPSNATMMPTRANELPTAKPDWAISAPPAPTAATALPSRSRSMSTLKCTVRRIEVAAAVACIRAPPTSRLAVKGTDRRRS